jgi:TonB family protein
MKSGPNLLVQWEPRWHAFVTSIKPGLSRSRAPLALECDVGMKPSRSTLASALMHLSVVLFFTLVFVHALRSPAYEHANPYDEFNAADYQIIYYRGQELPRMHDAGGAQAGVSGKSGGRELYSPTQVIRIARGNKLVDVIVDAPNIKLPRSNQPVANLLSLPSGALVAPPLAELRSITNTARLQSNVTPVPAAPNAPREKLPPLPVNSQVVPPTPTLGRQVAGMRLPDTGVVQVVPAPISAVPRDVGYVPKLILPATAVVGPAPNPSLPIGSSNINGPMIASVQVVDVVPPAPNMSGSGRGGRGGMIGSALNAIGSMMGSVGGVGTVSAAPPSNDRTGGGGGLGLIVSANPGGAVGVPEGEPGSIAMSPNGGREAGLGGSGGGTGIGHGTGTGSGSSGTGPGAAGSGSGLGLGAQYPGTSMGPGPGGSGSGQGTPGGIKGVTIEGGHVSLPSFATATVSPGSPTHGPKDKRNAPAITIIATSRSGGAVNLYGALKGSKVYTIYIDTAIGTALLQYAEHAAPDAEFAADLTAPEPLNYNMPSSIPRARVLLSCIMDKEGALKNVRILESARQDVTERVMAAVQRWRFRPVLRGDDPIDVDVILGFSVDTSR